MFADDIVANGVPDFDPRLMARTLDLIRRAHKFVLSPDFAAAADELRTDLDQIAKALPLCRLPTALTWIEFSEAHRDRHTGDPLRVGQALVKRVGFLMVADDPKDLARFRAYQFWENVNRVGLRAAAHMARFDMTGESQFGIWKGGTDVKVSDIWRRASEESRIAVSRVVQAELSDYGVPQSLAMLVGMPDLMKKAVIELSYDWNGEPAYIEAVLALLNARNTSETKSVDKTEHNRKRAKNKQRPLFSYHLLAIHPRQLARVREAARNGHGAADVRAHFVRGHWKVRRTGIFFWLPHRRGSEHVGIVAKDYKVTL
jgi:hypothetical protein